MLIELCVDGRSMPLTDKEARVALQAVKRYRDDLIRKPVKTSKRRELDMEAHYLVEMGMSVQEAARSLKITVNALKGCLRRVESGRYGSV